MTRHSLLLLCLLLITRYTIAQHPLVGTWEMVSIAGVNADGEKFQRDTTAIRETKIITPTHYILIARDNEDGKWKFNRCYAGQIKIDGSKYYEIPLLSSEPIYQNVKTDFSWNINGNDFIQSGFITRPDGKTIILDKFLFRRSSVAAVSGKKFVGSWETGDQGLQGLLIVTPTHWMLIHERNDEFVKGMGGVYKVKGNRAELTVLYGSGDEKNISAELKDQKIQINDISYSKVN